MKFVFVLAFLAGVILGSEALLKCYDCKSTIGWGSCNKEENVCSINQERCLKVYLQDGERESFTKKCARITECEKDTSYHCDTGTSDSVCEINCCKSNLCNAGARVGTNLVVLFGAFAVFTVFV